ncbi:hypothetical protein OG474_37890 [Kribbella sp. NBC_01505]|uniref:RNA polymerase sigma factor n=1 Tax=Kribbella sp. NBC_01505 TaxID=2903580 RepID=UPI00386A18DD
MLRVARSFVSTEESAAEVVQETWLAVIEGIDGFEGRSALRMPNWKSRIFRQPRPRSWLGTRGRGMRFAAQGCSRGARSLRCFGRSECRTSPSIRWRILLRPTGRLQPTPRRTDRHSLGQNSPRHSPNS